MIQTFKLKSKDLEIVKLNNLVVEEVEAALDVEVLVLLIVAHTAVVSG